jgi:CBS domain-containing protein
MQSGIETIERGATAREAATVLADSGIGSLVITDGDRPVGIVTGVNLTRLLADGHDPETTVVEAIMTSPVISPNSLPWNA